MKRCFSTLCCLDASAEQVIDYAVAGNMDGVEARVNEKGETFGFCTVADSGKIRELFNASGIEITDLALSCSIRGNDDVQINIGKKGIDFASALGSKAVRIFVGNHQKSFSENADNDMNGIAEALCFLSGYAKEKNVEIWLETHSSFSSGRAMKELIDTVQRDNIKVIWDVMHSLEYHEMPAETVEFLKDKIVHVHLKDGYPSDDEDATQYIHTDLGKGTMPVREVLRALESIRYNGYLSLEWESPWRPEIRDLYQNTNDLLRSYNRFLDNAE